MSLTSQIARNTIIQGLGKIGGTILGLLAIGMITRYLGQTGFGQYTTVMTFLQFFGILVDFGLTLVTVQMISEPNADQEKILSNLFTLRFISAFLFLGLAPIIVLFLPYEPLIKQGVAISAASFLFIALNQVITGLFQKNLAMGRVALSEVLNRLLLVILVWPIISYNYGLLAILLAVVISNAFQFLLLYISSFKFVKIKFRFDKEVWKKIFHLSWPMAITIALNLIYLKTDTLILSLVRSQAEVGIYGATYKVLEVLVTLPIMFAGLVLPVLTRTWTTNDKDRFKRVFQKAFDALSLIAIPLVVGTWMTAKEVMTVVAGREFAASGEVLNILIIAAAVIFIGSLFGHAILSINRQKQTIWGYTLSAILAVVGYLIFIPRYSYFGAAWMTVFSEAFVTLSIIYVFYRTTRFFPSIKIWWKSALATLVMALVLGLIKSSLVTPFVSVNVFLWVTLASGVYFLVLIATRALSMEMIREIVKFK